MEHAGQTRIVRAEDVAHMGITEVLRHAPFIYSQYRKLVASIKRDRPDIAILIDFPDVNFRLAKHLHKLNIPVVWFVSPQLWAWKRSRLRWVQQRVDKMLVIFPFEEAFYRHRGVDAEFVGHPLAELPLPTSTRESYAATHNLDPAKTWIALLPGSRWKEIRANLPALHELAMTDLITTHASSIIFDGEHLNVPTTLNTRYEFLVPVASTIDRNRLQAYITELNAEALRYFTEELVVPTRFQTLPQPLLAAPTVRAPLTLVPDAREALHHARASVVASGTATVQAAVIGNPFIVVYRVSPLTFSLAKRLVSYPHEWKARPDSNGNLPISMVNLIARQRLVPELLQSSFTAANVASALAPILTEGPERDRQIAGLARVRQSLQTPTNTPAITRVADTVLALLSS